MKDEGSEISDQESGATSNARNWVPQVSRLRPGKESGRSEIVAYFLGPAIICFAAFIATTPDLIWGNSCGHDFDFHLASWLDAQAA